MEEHSEPPSNIAAPSKAGAKAEMDMDKYYLRAATRADAPALTSICLRTADAGKDASAHHAYGELPGLFYAVPYVHLPGAGGFVLVRRGPPAASKEENTDAKDEVDTKEGGAGAEPARRTLPERAGRHDQGAREPFAREAQGQSAAE